MPKHVTYRERARSRSWNARFLLERDRSLRWLRRHARQIRSASEPERPWWWRLANR